MNVIGQTRYRLNIKKCNCLYFYPHFYEIFKKERNLVQNAIAINRFCSKEVLTYCRQCENDFICKYFGLHCSSDEFFFFFFEKRKVLIQHFPFKTSRYYYLTVNIRKDYENVII